MTTRRGLLGLIAALPFASGGPAPLWPRTFRPMKIGGIVGESATESVLTPSQVQTLRLNADADRFVKTIDAATDRFAAEYSRLAQIRKAPEPWPLMRDDGTAAQIGDTMRIESGQVHFDPPAQPEPIRSFRHLAQRIKADYAAPPPILDVHVWGVPNRLAGVQINSEGDAV